MRALGLQGTDGWQLESTCCEPCLSGHPSRRLPLPNWFSPVPVCQAVFLDTPGIITDKRNKLEEKMMAAVQQVGAAMRQARTRNDREEGRVGRALWL